MRRNVPAVLGLSYSTVERLLWNMVRLTNVAGQPTGVSTYGQIVSTTATSTTDSQYAGYRRTTPDRGRTGSGRSCCSAR